MTKYTHTALNVFLKQEVKKSNIRKQIFPKFGSHNWKRPIPSELQLLFRLKKATDQMTSERT